MTADALHCQREFCRQIRAARGHYLIIVKQNQPTLYRDIELLFEEPPEGEVFTTAEMRDRHGDRREVRRLWASTALREYLNWPGVEQVCKVERVSERKGKETRQVRYVITDLGPEVGAGVPATSRPGTLGHREQAALRARRDVRGGCQSGPQGLGTGGDGGVAKRRPRDTAPSGLGEHRCCTPSQRPAAALCPQTARHLDWLNRKTLRNRLRSLAPTRLLWYTVAYGRWQ